jgi:hypothetical protein
VYEYHDGFRLPLEHRDRISSGWACIKLKLETDEDYYALIKKKCPDFEFGSLISYPK